MPRHDSAPRDTLSGLPRAHRSGRLTFLLALALGIVPMAFASSGLGLFGRRNEGPHLRGTDLHEPAAELATLPRSTSERSQLCRQWLAEGIRRLETVRDFQATFYRQERVNGRLLEPESLLLKMRAEPRAVYLCWIEPNEGRELIWHRDANEGKILIHECGWKGRISPVLKLSPDHPLIRKAAKRGIDELGIWNLAETLERNCRQLDRPEVNVEMSETEISNRACYRFEISFPEPLPELDSNRTVLFVDRETKIPVGCELYECAGQGEPLLQAAYYYEDLKLNAELDDADFDPENPDYNFTKVRTAKTEVTMLE